MLLPKLFMLARFRTAFPMQVGSIQTFGWIRSLSRSGSLDAAPIFCAGATVLRGIRRTDTKAGEWIAIPGAGGGLGHLAVQYAKALGLKCIAIDGGEEKEALCKKLGADIFIGETFFRGLGTLGPGLTTFSQQTSQNPKTSSQT
jgi:hypothetical protein